MLFRFVVTLSDDCHTERSRSADNTKINIKSYGTPFDSAQGDK
jgi:hypothetical protein